MDLTDTQQAILQLIAERIESEGAPPPVPPGSLGAGRCDPSHPGPGPWHPPGAGPAGREAGRAGPARQRAASAGAGPGRGRPADRWR
ncbi:hypothetical protein G6F65_013208 [Rhizopus arrhizus]|nr:hypothetical protein G6F65_013208 [Rhizopus arrhizus]